ncbi:MAG: DNA primase small subunit PriS [Candidatus Bathyarchaeia archaeon]
MGTMILIVRDKEPKGLGLREKADFSTLKTLAFVKESFLDYYRASQNAIRAPSDISRREFGFQTFGERLMVRHRSFKSQEELLRFIQATVPSDCYYSAAYYESPTLEMEEKGWLGADLIFDVDADHIPTKCKAIHDRWKCLDCQKEGRGASPDRCPQCGSQKIKEEQWFCEECLEAAKLEALKLMDILLQDFGLSPGEVQVYFSGHRGYHIHVESEVLRELDQMARKEIVDYAMGLGLDLAFYGFKDAIAFENPFDGHRQEGGWHRRILQGLYDFLSTATVDSLEEIGIKKVVSEEIIRNRDWILKVLWERGPSSAVRGLGSKAWEKLLRYSIDRQVARIDSVVTTDIHRLIRLPGSLHGKTGLMKASVEGAELEAFDPLKASVVFQGGPVRVYVRESSHFRLGDETFGPFKDTVTELPRAAALLLVCKGLGDIP